MPLDPKIFLSSEKLPSLPAAAVKVLELASASEPDLKKLIEVVKCDPALVAKILRATNSSLFGFRRRVTAIEQAIPLLGTIMVRTLVLSFSLTSDAVQPGPLAEFYRLLWRNSLTQAVAAESLTKYDERGIAGEYFVAGLLQDIGALALLRCEPEQYAEILAAQEENPDRALTDIEQELLGFTHVEIGVELCRRWRLAESVQGAIAVHHLSAEEVLQRVAREVQPLAKALSLGSSTAEYFCGTRKASAQLAVQQKAALYYNLNGETLHQMLFGIDRRVRESAELFSLDIGNYPSYDEILVQANAELAAIAVEAQLASMRADAQAKAAEQVIHDLEGEKEQFRNQAYTDFLTGAYNRHFFEKVLELEHNRCQRYSESVGLIFLDLDQFKTLNDTYGHPFGDQVLKRASKAVQASVRSSDVVARYGGDEFVVLLLRIAQEDLHRTASRIREAIDSIEFVQGNQTVRISGSVGAVLWEPRRGGRASPAELIEAADRAMYEAKRAGANRVHLADFAASS